MDFINNKKSYVGALIIKENRNHINLSDPPIRTIGYFCRVTEGHFFIKWFKHPLYNHGQEVSYAWRHVKDNNIILLQRPCDISLLNE